MSEISDIDTKRLVENYIQEVKESIADIDITAYVINQRLCFLEQSLTGIETIKYLILEDLKLNRKLEEEKLQSSPEIIEKLAIDLLKERREHAKHNSGSRMSSLKDFLKYEIAKQTITIGELRWDKYHEETSIERSLEKGMPVRIMSFSEKKDFEEKIAKGEIEEQDLDSFIKETKEKIKSIEQLIKECEFTICDKEDMLKHFF